MSFSIVAKAQVKLASHPEHYTIRNGKLIASHGRTIHGTVIPEQTSPIAALTVWRNCVVTAADAIRVWDTLGKLINQFDGSANILCVWQDQLYASGSELTIRQYTWEGQVQVYNCDSRVTALAGWDNDVVIGFEDGSIHLIHEGKLIYFGRRHYEPVNYLVPFGDYLVSGSTEARMLVVWSHRGTYPSEIQLLSTKLTGMCRVDNYLIISCSGPDTLEGWKINGKGGLVKLGSSSSKPCLGNLIYERGVLYAVGLNDIDGSRVIQLIVQRQ